jgi:preprotein translocase subunit YajC
MFAALEPLSRALVRFAQEASPSVGAAPAGSAPVAADAAPQQQSPIFTIVFFALIFGVFYFLIIRPQSKRAKEHQGFLEQLKVGSRVVTQAGLFGRIAGIEGNQIQLEIANNVTVRMLKSQIVGLEKDAEQAVSAANKT